MLLHFFCNSQEKEFGFVWAISAGLAASQIDGDGYSGYHQPGLTLSLITTYKLPKFILSGEMRLIQKGSRSNLIFENQGYFFSIRLNYIHFVPTISYQFLTNWVITLGLPLGSLFYYSEKDIYGKRKILAPYRKFEIAGLSALSKRIFKNGYFEIGYEYSLLPVSNNYLSGWTIWMYKGSYNNTIFCRIIYSFTPPATFK